MNKLSSSTHTMDVCKRLQASCVPCQSTYNGSYIDTVNISVSHTTARAEAEACDIMDYCLEQGINFFDTGQNSAKHMAYFVSTSVK